MIRLISVGVVAFFCLHLSSCHFPILPPLPFMRPIFNPVLPLGPMLGPYMNPMLSPMMRPFPPYNSPVQTRRNPPMNNVNQVINKGTPTTIRRGDTMSSRGRTNQARESSMISVRNHEAVRTGARGMGRP